MSLVIKVLPVSRRDSAMTSAALYFERIPSLITLLLSPVKLLQAQGTRGTPGCRGGGCST